MEYAFQVILPSTQLAPVLNCLFGDFLALTRKPPMTYDCLRVGLSVLQK